jgi:hypothetical protein
MEIPAISSKTLLPQKLSRSQGDNHIDCRFLIFAHSFILGSILRGQGAGFMRHQLLKALLLSHKNKKFKIFLRSYSVLEKLDSQLIPKLDTFMGKNLQNPLLHGNMAW